MKVNDILKCRWGYNMVIVDFYKVVKFTDTSVWLQPLESKIIKSDGAGASVGECVAGAPKEGAQIIRRKICKSCIDGKEWVKISPDEFACEWEGKPVHFDYND